MALNGLTRRRPTQLRLSGATLDSRDSVLKQAKLTVVDARSREVYDQLQVLPQGFSLLFAVGISPPQCHVYDHETMCAIARLRPHRAHRPTLRS